MKKTIKKSANLEPSLFFLNFQGELMSFLLDSRMSTVTETDQGVEQLDLPLSVQGFFVDECDDYYYVGEIPGVIDQAVPKRRLLHVKMIKPADPLLGILDDMGKPGKNEVN